MKKIIIFICTFCMVLGMAACGISAETDNNSIDPSLYSDATEIVLSDDGITVGGEAISIDASSDVYSANDIVYYESGKDFTYGEGTEGDAHTAEEASAHTVVHITKAGAYRIKGKLSKGQIAIDLGKDAKKDEEAIVFLILDGVDITCEVAPAVIFYNVYECGSDDADDATKDVDTTKAGANVIIADDSENTVNGSYVARIYEPETVVLNSAGTEVVDADKLHKYDAAFYSKRSMNVYGEANNSGKLTINAKNEGLDSELHLTVNGGIIDIHSGNDGINTNEDGVSVTTINGGSLTITVNGETGEGDGIDSNGWLVINGGTVKAYACSTSGDAGIDSDMGIYINGGTVIATGNMLDRISGASQNCAVFNFQKRHTSGEKLKLTGDYEFNLEAELVNDCSILIYSSPELKTGQYSLYINDVQYGGALSGGMGNHGGMKPEGFEPPEGERPEMPEGEKPSKGERPEMPDGTTPPENGVNGGRPNGQNPSNAVLSSVFEIKQGINTFYSVDVYTETGESSQNSAAESTAETEGATSEKKNNTLWVVLAAVAGVLVIGSTIATVFLFKNKQE